MQLRNHQHLGTLSPILTQEVNSEDLIVKILNIGQMKQETTWKLSQTNSTFGLSQEMDSIMAMMHSQINRAISSASFDRVIPEIKNIMSSMSSSENRDTETSSSPDSQENRETNRALRSKITKKDSLSTGDLRNTEDLGPYKKDSCYFMNGISWSCIDQVFTAGI